MDHFWEEHEKKLNQYLKNTTFREQEEEPLKVEPLIKTKKDIHLMTTIDDFDANQLLINKNKNKNNSLNSIVDQPVKCSCNSCSCSYKINNNYGKNIQFQHKTNCKYRYLPCKHYCSLMNQNNENINENNNQKNKKKWFQKDDLNYFLNKQQAIHHVINNNKQNIPPFVPFLLASNQEGNTTKWKSFLFPNSYYLVSISFLVLFGLLGLCLFGYLLFLVYYEESKTNTNAKGSFKTQRKKTNKMKLF